MSELKNNLKDTAAAFDTFLRVERNLSVKTREAYQYDLMNFFAFAASKTKVTAETLTPADITAAHIKQYLAHLQGDKHYKSATLARTLSSVRVFFRFCIREGHIESNPAQFVFTPKISKRLPVYLIESELQKILAAPDLETIWGKRDYAILVTLGLTGLRRGEVVSLNIDGVDFLSKTLRVIGKGSKERIVPMNVWVEQSLQEWLSVKPVTADSNPVFTNQKLGTRLTGQTLWDIVKRYLQIAGIEKSKISPHKLRHTFATLLHFNSIELVEIQKLLGHASIVSTQIYTHTNADKLRQAVDSLNPILRKRKDAKLNRNTD